MKDNCEPMLRRLGLSRRQLCNKAQRVGAVGNWIFDCTSGEYWWSDQVYRIYGLPRSTQLKPELFTERVHPEDAQRVQNAFSQVLEGKRCHIIHRVCIQGKTKWLEQSGRLYAGKSYPAPYVVGMVRDVTALYVEEARLESKRAGLSAITAYLAETTDTTDLRAIVSSVKRTIRKRMDVALIAVFARQGERISRVIPHGMDPMQAFLFQDIQYFIGYRSVLQGKRQLCPVEDYPSQLGREALLALGGKSVVSLPIKHGSKTIGALSMVLKRPGNLNREEDEFCRTICGYLSNQLNSSLLYEQLKEELALRVRLESDREIIFNESVDFIAIFDSEGCFAQINPAFAARLGYLPQTLIGRPVFDYMHPDDRSLSRYTFNQLAVQGVIRGFSNRFISADGRIIYLENNLKYTKETGCSIVIARDVSGHHPQKEKTDELEKSPLFEKQVGEFFTGLSHEFKTPLNIILSSLELIRMKSTKENEQRFEDGYAKFFNYAYENCYKLLRLSTNLVDASRIDSGFYQLHMSRIELSGLLREITESARVYTESWGLKLYYFAPFEGETWTVCDSGCIDRIVLNLISNSIKNTPAGGEIRIWLRDEPEFFRITVEDTGTGISKDVFPVAFDKFRTGKPILPGRQEGSGLGLPLSKSLVELHGGTIDAENRAEKGCSVSFTIAKNIEPSVISEEVTLAEGAFKRDALDSRAKMELGNLK